MVFNPSKCAMINFGMLRGILGVLKVAAQVDRAIEAAYDMLAVIAWGIKYKSGIHDVATQDLG